MRKQYGIIRNAMKKLQILMLAGLAAAAARGAVMDGLAAKVDNECIMIGDVLAEVRRNPAAREQFAAAAHDKAKLAALYQNAIDTLIDRKLILKAAAEKKMEMQEWVIDNRVREIVKENFHGDRNELEAELQKSNTPFEEWRNIIREDLIIAGMRYQIIEKYAHQVSPSAMRAEYDTHRSRYADEAKTTVRVILLKPAAEGQPSVKDRANEILKKLGEPNADFAALAHEYSSDSHAKDGGLWKDVKPDEAFRPEIAEAIAKLKVGEHSGLVDLDGWGFIVRKEAENAEKTLSFSEAYDRIVRNVRRDSAAKAYEDWMKRLRAEAFIKTYPMPEK